MKISNRAKGLTIEIVCAGYILLFVYAATTKLLDYENFQVQLGQSPLVSTFAGWLSWLVPLTELVLAGMLAFARTRNIALYGSYILMVMFSAYIFIMLNYASYVPCSCGGVLEKMTWTAHLFFNLGFVLLGAAALLLIHQKEGRSLKRTGHSILTLVGLAFISISLVAGLSQWSLSAMHKDNPFIRHYARGCVQEHQLDLGYNSYYFAGFSEANLFLGNTTGPLYVTAVDSTLTQKSSFRMKLDTHDLPFTAPVLRVAPPYLYLIDGSVPVLYKGTLVSKTLQLQWQGHANEKFSQPQIMDSVTLAGRTIDSRSGNLELARLHFGSLPEFSVRERLLQQQVDGLFDADGMLLYSMEAKKIIYTHFYRNELIIAGSDLGLAYRSHTIDTVSMAKIEVAHLKDRNEKKLSQPPVLVNKLSAADDNLLFVASAQRGRFEDKNLWREATIIDVYDIVSQTYIASFYLYGIDGKKAKAIAVKDGRFYALIGKQLVHYRLDTTITQHYRSH